jgi:hypothetical protein
MDKTRDFLPEFGLDGWFEYLSMDGTIVALLAVAVSGVGISGLSKDGGEGGGMDSGWREREETEMGGGRRKGFSTMSSFSGTSVTMALWVGV